MDPWKIWAGTGVIAVFILGSTVMRLRADGYTYEAAVVAASAESGASPSVSSARQSSTADSGATEVSYVGYVPPHFSRSYATAGHLVTTGTGRFVVPAITENVQVDLTVTGDGSETQAEESNVTDVRAEIALDSGREVLTTDSFVTLGEAAEARYSFSLDNVIPTRISMDDNATAVFDMPTDVMIVANLSDNGMGNEPSYDLVDFVDLAADTVEPNQPSINNDMSRVPSGLLNQLQSLNLQEATKRILVAQYLTNTAYPVYQTGLSGAYVDNYSLQVDAANGAIVAAQNDAIKQAQMQEQIVEEEGLVQLVRFGTQVEDLRFQNYLSEESLNRNIPW